MFSAAPARGPEDSAESQRVGPGSYKCPTTLMDHPILEKPQYTLFPQTIRMKVPRSNGDGSDPDPAKITYCVKRVISTSKKPPSVKFGRATRPDYGSMSATKNTRYILPPGQVGQKQPESYQRTPSSYSLSGRTKIMGQPGVDTPGPEYELPEVMGTAPALVFGTSTRASEADGMEDTPGPGSFSKPPAIGKQAESQLRSSSSATLVGGGRNQFGSAFAPVGSNATPSSAKYKPENCREATSKGVPKITLAQRLPDPALIGQSQGNRVGPGSYHILTTLTPKHPTIKTSWAPKMAMAKRPSMANPNATDVAPHDTECNHCYPHLSTSKSSPAVGFQKGARGDFTSSSNATPSPARYNVAGVNLGKLTGYLNSPAASLSGRTKFGSF
jgi:hypothetical protein